MSYADFIFHRSLIMTNQLARKIARTSFSKNKTFFDYINQSLRIIDRIFELQKQQTQQ